MTCQEFLVRHAEFMDELMSSSEVARWEAHLSECPSCAHYDRVIRQGIRILQASPQVSPSSDFFPRLQHRLYNLEDELRLNHRGPGASAMTSLAIAGILALLAWSPLLRLDQMLVPSSATSSATTAQRVPGQSEGGAAAGELGESPFMGEMGLGAGTLTIGGRADMGRAEWRRVRLTGPSALRPVSRRENWFSAGGGVPASSWERGLSGPDLDASFELQISPRYPSLSTDQGEWRYRPGYQPVLPVMGRGLAQDRFNTYPPLRAGAETGLPAGAELRRATDSITIQH